MKNAPLWILGLIFIPAFLWLIWYQLGTLRRLMEINDRYKAREKAQQSQPVEPDIDVSS